MKEFLWPVRVYYEDTDSGGVVYHANYAKYMERARTELLRSFGFEQDRLIRDDGVLFAVRSLSLEYHRPARFNDLLQVSARVVEPGRASVIFEQEIRREAPEPMLLCSGQVRVACLDAVTMKPKALPDAMLGEFSREV